MKIDRARAQKAFADYAAHYNAADAKVKLKIDHTYRVAALCARIAQSLALSPEDVDLAWLSGILHDVGRFEQLRRYNTFIDAQSVSHAALSVAVLFDEGRIRDYLDDAGADALLRTAVEWHSAFRLPEALDDRTRLFCQILRDADKIDILRVNVEIPMEEIYNVSTAALRRSPVTPAVLDAFLDAVFSHAEGPISVKTRLGVSSPDEFAAILDIYDRYPICELTIHPRVMRQLYRGQAGQADRAAFAEALPRCTMPVCYNGDVTTPEELRALETQFPQLSGIMIGRGFIADPALLRRARGGTGASREELRGYLDDLYHGYTELFGSAGCAVSRMKAHWFYLIHRFAGSEKLEKQLRKAREPWEYEVLVNQIFTLPML